MLIIRSRAERIGVHGINETKHMPNIGISCWPGTSGATAAPSIELAKIERTPVLSIGFSQQRVISPNKIHQAEACFHVFSPCLYCLRQPTRLHLTSFQVRSLPTSFIHPLSSLYHNGRTYSSGPRPQYMKVPSYCSLTHH